MLNKHTRTLTKCPEVLIIIFSNLKITDAINLGRVDKQMRKIYLFLVNQTKYIDYNYNRRIKNNEMSKYIQTILQNISIGNRTVILKIYPDECKGELTQSPQSPQPPQSPIFKIIHLSTLNSGYGLKIHLMNKDNIRIIYFDMLNNYIMSDNLKKKYDLVLKFIKKSPFNAKTRPMKYVFCNNILYQNKQL